MLTERYRPALRWLTAAGVASTLVLSGCASAGSPKKAGLNLPVAPAPSAAPSRSAAPTSGGSAAPSPVDLVGQELVTLGRDPAFTTASKAVAEFGLARTLQGKGDAVITEMRTLTTRRPIDCRQVTVLLHDAAALAAQSQVPVAALPPDTASLVALAQAAEPKVAALQRKIASLAAGANNSADATTADRLRSYAASANALEVNLRVAAPLAWRVASVYGRLTNSLATLRAVAGRSAKVCGTSVAARKGESPASSRIQLTAKTSTARKP